MTDANPKSGAKSRIPAIDDTPENLLTLKAAPGPGVKSKLEGDAK